MAAVSVAAAVDNNEISNSNVNMRVDLRSRGPPHEFKINEKYLRIVNYPYVISTSAEYIKQTRLLITEITEVWNYMTSKNHPFDKYVEQVKALIFYYKSANMSLGESIEARKRELARTRYIQNKKRDDAAYALLSLQKEEQAKKK